MMFPRHDKLSPAAGCTVAVCYCGVAVGGHRVESLSNGPGQQTATDNNVGKTTRAPS